MQISIVILLFLDQISGRGKSFEGGKLRQGGAPPPLWEKARNNMGGRGDTDSICCCLGAHAENASKIDVSEVFLNEFCE